MTTWAKRLGYGGSAEVAGAQVLITGGSFDSATSPSYQNPLDTPPSTGMRGRVLHASGVTSYTGNVSLDVTAGFMGVLGVSAGLLERRYSFAVGINDGENHQQMSGCHVTSLTLNGAPGGLISASLAFMGPSAPADVVIDNAFIRDSQVPYGYWYSGATASGGIASIREWSFSMNQEVVPVYGNEDSTDPLYLRVGLVSYSLQVTTYEALGAHDAVCVATKKFTLTGVTTATGYSFGGQSDLGHFTHNFETSSATGYSSAVVLSQSAS